MKRVILAGLAILLFLTGFLAGYYSKESEEEKEIFQSPSEYTWTRAICNSDKECIDIEIRCENGRVAGLEPILNKVSHDEGWQDLRNTRLC